MQFSDFDDDKNPSQAIFLAALDVVFAGSEGLHEDLQPLSPECRTVYLARALYAVLDSGGLTAMSMRSLAHNAPETLQALKDLGATQHVALFEKALLLFSTGSAAEDDEAHLFQPDGPSELPQANPEVEALNATFDRSEESLIKAIEIYVKSHPNAQVLAGSPE